MKPRLKFDGSVLVLTKGTVFPRTKKAAMRMSIEKWEVVVQGHKDGIQPIYSSGSDTCALCDLYIEEHCSKCPIKKYSKGDLYCNSTPFEVYCMHPSLAHAKEELAFLRMVQKKEGLL
jgi:hypothetical protein